MGHVERLGKNKVGKSWCRHFWPDWRSSLQRVIHSEREAQVPLLLLPAQVYDNPNKLWCAAQTLKTLIGTKSNRLCLSGQRAERVTVCALLCSPFQLSISPCPQIQHHSRSTYPFLFLLSLLLSTSSFVSTCNFPLLFLCPFCTTPSFAAHLIHFGDSEKCPPNQVWEMK